MSNHKYINYFITFISLTIVFYYFFNSFSKSIKNHKDISEEITVSENMEKGIFNRIKNIENRLFEKYSLGKNFTQLESCENGSELAIKDAKNKIYKLYAFGAQMIPTTEESRFIDFYEYFLKSEYGISTAHLGSIVTPKAECYSNKMEELIKTEFGETFFEQAKKEAKELFKKKDYSSKSTNDPLSKTDNNLTHFNT